MVGKRYEYPFTRSPAGRSKNLNGIVSAYTGGSADEFEVSGCRIRFEESCRCESCVMTFNEMAAMRNTTAALELEADIVCCVSWT